MAALFTEAQSPEAMSLGGISVAPPARTHPGPPRQLSAIRTWVLNRAAAGASSLDFVDAMTRFANVPEAALGEAFEELVQEGLLRALDADGRKYAIEDPQGQHTFDAVSEPSAGKVIRRGVKALPVDSTFGGLHSVPGSQCTLSATTRKRSAAPTPSKMAGNSAGPGGAWLETQSSGGMTTRRAKKMSIVQEPIKQVAKRPRSAAAVPLSATKSNVAGRLRSGRNKSRLNMARG
jgi:hypothetical protein